jgi:hypothetical protein
MKISYDSNLSFPCINESITILTNGSIVDILKIQYDENKGILRIPILRKSLVQFKKSLLGPERPIYSQERIKSMVIISNVVNMELVIDEDMASAFGSSFTILFGLSIKNNHIFLGSAEEVEGKMLCEINIEINKSCIEIYDDE